MKRHLLYFATRIGALIVLGAAAWAACEARQIWIGRQR